MQLGLGAWLPLLTVLVPMASSGRPARAAPASFEAVATLSHDSAAPGEHIELRIVFRQLADEPARGLRIGQLRAPGLERLGLEREPGPGTDFAAGEVAAFRIGLRVIDHRLGKRGLAATLVWTEGEEDVRERAAIVAASLDVVSRWSEERAPGWILLSDLLLKGLGFPLALALAGLMINRLFQQRAERLEKLKLLLARVWRIAEKHYLPIGSAVLRLQKELDRHRALGQGDAPKRELEGLDRNASIGSVFAAMIVLLWRDTALTRDVGGWILQDREGEKLVGDLSDDFQKLWREALGRTEVERLLLDLGEDPSLAELMKRFERGSRPPLGRPSVDGVAGRWRTLRDRFERWMGDAPSFDAGMELVGTMTIVLYLEANRLYGPLYGSSGELARMEKEMGLGDLSDARSQLLEHAVTLKAKADGMPDTDPNRERVDALATSVRKRANDVAKYLGRHGISGSAKRRTAG